MEKKGKHYIFTYKIIADVIKVIEKKLTKAKEKNERIKIIIELERNHCDITTVPQVERERHK